LDRVDLDEDKVDLDSLDKMDMVAGIVDGQVFPASFVDHIDLCICTSWSDISFEGVQHCDSFPNLYHLPMSLPKHLKASTSRHLN
jgi:hypothetical protein